MRAGHRDSTFDGLSVRPLCCGYEDLEVMANVVDSDADDEAVDGEMVEDEGERIGLPKDDKVFKKVKDPKLPSQQEVDQHWIMGHLPYRNWCPICVKAQGRDRSCEGFWGGKKTP